MLKFGGLSSNLQISIPSIPIFSNDTIVVVGKVTASCLFKNVVTGASYFGIGINKYYENYTNKLNGKRGEQCISTFSRRRVRYDDEDEKDEEEYGNNADIAMLETYSESAKNEALLVRATLDGQEEEVLIFKGFSSCLSYRTSSDPSRSILPSRAVITSIDRVKGPFDPSNIEYIEKSLSLQTFKDRMSLN